MDEYNTGMDREVKVYFQKIMKSFGIGVFWLMVSMVAGLFFKLGYWQHGWRWQNTVFYAVLILTLILVVRYLLRIWRK